MTGKPTSVVRYKRRLLTLLTLSVVLACGFLYLYYLNQTQHLLNDKEITTYAKTSCQLLGKKLNTIEYTAHKYRADFLVSYTVNGIYYRKWVSGNGLDESYFSEANKQEDILSRYQVGRVYTCFYYPRDPGRVVFVPRHTWGSLVPAVIVSMISIGICFILLQNLFIYSHLTTLALQRYWRAKRHKFKR